MRNIVNTRDIYWLDIRNQVKKYTIITNNYSTLYAIFPVPQL